MAKRLSICPTYTWELHSLFVACIYTTYTHLDHFNLYDLSKKHHGGSWLTALSSCLNACFFCCSRAVFDLRMIPAGFIEVTRLNYALAKNGALWPASDGWCSAAVSRVVKPYVDPNKREIRKSS